MGYRVVNAEVLERKAEQAVFYQEPTLHGTLFWALRGSLEQKEVWSPELLGVLEPKDKLRYKLFHSDPPALKLRWVWKQLVGRNQVAVRTRAGQIGSWEGAYQGGDFSCF